MSVGSADGAKYWSDLTDPSYGMLFFPASDITVCCYQPSLVASQGLDCRQQKNGSGFGGNSTDRTLVAVFRHLLAGIQVFFFKIILDHIVGTNR